MTEHHHEQHEATSLAEMPPSRFLWITGQWPAAISALRHRNFRYFWFGQLISLMGTWMQNTVQGWLVFTLAKQEFGAANSAFYVGAVGALGSLPMFLFTLFAGVISDRYDKRHILITTQITLMLLAAALAMLVGSGMIRLWQVALFAVLAGTAMAFDMPTRQAFVKDLASPPDLLNAIALNSSIFNLARIMGPFIAGILMGISRIGIAGVLYLNAASYLAVIAGLWMIRTQASGRAAHHVSVWAHLIEGFRYVAGHAVIRLLMMVMAVYSVFGFSYAVLLPVITNQVLRRNENGYALLLAATGIGALAGALFLAAMAQRVRKGRVLLAGGVLFSLALVIFSQSRSFYLSFGMLSLVGAGLIVSSASINSMIQEITPDHLRGRVISMWAFIFAGFTPVGALYAGIMAHYTSTQTALLFGAVACLLALGVISLRARWLWHLE